MRSGREEARRFRESAVSPDIRYREELISPVSLLTGPLDSSLLDTTLTVSDEESRCGDVVSRSIRQDRIRNPVSFAKDPPPTFRYHRVPEMEQSSKVARSYSQPSHSVRMKGLANNAIKQHYLKMIVFKPSNESLGVIITSSSSTNGFIIAHIDPASVIDRDGRFRVGDKIIRINGHDLVELTISQVREILKHNSNQVEIEVIRDPED